MKECLECPTLQLCCTSWALGLRNTVFFFVLSWFFSFVSVFVFGKEASVRVKVQESLWDTEVGIP